MEIKIGQKLLNELAAQPEVSSGVSSFLAWLLLWLRLCVVRSQRGSEQAPVRIYAPNRFCRRRRRLDIVPARDNRPYFSFVRPGLSPTQFMERLVSFSGRGRVRVYGMRYWRKTVKGKAAPLGTEHEYWRDPIVPMGKLLCGVWAAHLWPRWWLFFNLNLINARDASRVSNPACLGIMSGHHSWVSWLGTELLKFSTNFVLGTYRLT